MNRTTMLMIALLAVLMLGANRGYAEQPPFPCHPNPNADQDMAAVAARGDIASLPAPLQSQIVRLCGTATQPALSILSTRHQRL